MVKKYHKNVDHYAVDFHKKYLILGTCLLSHLVLTQVMNKNMGKIFLLACGIHGAPELQMAPCSENCVNDALRRRLVEFLVFNSTFGRCGVRLTVEYPHHITRGTPIAAGASKLMLPVHPG